MRLFNLKRHNRIRRRKREQKYYPRSKVDIPRRTRLLVKDYVSLRRHHEVYRLRNMEYPEFTFSMPTCYQLGIPNEPSPSDIQGVPYSFPAQMVPIPHPLYDCNLEPAFIRKRNERERIRVRHVNEGYARLREHLPNEPTEKRMSKVETLRAAIRYIRRLETLLDRTQETAFPSEKSPVSQTK